MTAFVEYLIVFLAIGIVFVFFHLMLGKLIRPAKPDAEKLTIYECGEPTIGTSWIQFDLRFYVVALLFVIFDVEVVFFFPWAVVFGNAAALARPDLPETARPALTAKLLPEAQRPLVPGSNAERDVIAAAPAARLAWMAFWDLLIFFGVLLVGFAYLWKRGDLDWVRSTLAESATAEQPAAPSPAPAVAEPVMAGVGHGS